MYVDASVGTSGNQAHFTSTTLQQSGSYCEMVFYYHMYGEHIGTLQVSVAKCKISLISKSQWAGAHELSGHCFEMPVPS